MNKSEVLFDKVKSDKRFLKLVVIYRDIMNIPIEGFNKDDKEYKNWEKRNKNKNILMFGLFYKDICKILPLPRILYNIAINYLLFNFVQTENIPFNEFKLFIIEKAAKSLPSGIYLKIGEYANATEIKKFITDESENLRELQKIYIRNNGLPIIPNLRASTTQKRNLIIKNLKLKSKAELKEMSGEKMSGEIYNDKVKLIQLILEKDNFKTSKVAIKNTLYMKKK